MRKINLFGLGMCSAVAAVAVAGSAMAIPTGVAINGGSSWSGWTLQGNAQTAGIWVSGSTTRNFDMYQSYFTLDGTQAVTGSPNCGDSSSSLSSGSWQLGDRVLGVGLAYGGGQTVRNLWVTMDFGGDSINAASSVGANNGTYSYNTGDATTYFAGTSQAPITNHFRNFTYSVFNGYSADGSSNFTQPYGPGYDNSLADPVRSFAIASDGDLSNATSFQMFYNIDAAIRAGVGTGNFVAGTSKVGIAEFDASWSGTFQSYAAVPAPGAAALVGLAGLMATRRRKA